MQTLYHREEHFRGGETVKDIVIGMSDGLTVPFALAAGISGAISAAHIVVTAAERPSSTTAAGSIRLGLLWVIRVLSNGFSGRVCHPA